MPLPKKIPQSQTSASKASSDVSDDQKRVVVNRYRVEKKLGSGNFGTAYLVSDLKTSIPDDMSKVLKQIPCGDLEPDETVDAMHEAKLLSKLNHSGIVRFHDSFVDGEFFCIVTEFCEGGDLDDYMTRMKKRGQTIPEKQVMDWTAQLLLAVHYMHGRRVLHRDLKARNIFLRNNCVKIGDFGISRILMGSSDMATTFTGTPYYMSPEVLKHEGYNSKSDVWSIGCIVYELCCLKHAFEGQGLMGVMFKIVEGDCPQVGEKYSKGLQEMLQSILTKDPSKRPSAFDVLKLPFVSRHLEKMKINMDTEANNLEEEAKAIELTLQKKHHKKDLEDEQLKGMTARERMRLRKQEEADRKARELAEASRINLEKNMMRKQYINEQKHTLEPAPWTNQERREKTFLLPEESTLTPKMSLRPKTSQVHFEEYEMGDNHRTLVPSNGPAETYTVNTVKKFPQMLLAKSTNFDDRPITPMKNRMVYDLRNSSLDFRDGVPEDPKIAEKFYSQYEEDFHEDQDVSPKAKDIQEHHSSSGEEEEQEDSGTDEDYSHTLIAEEADLASRMQDQLEFTKRAKYGNNNNETIVLADDTVAGAFGPGARTIKIQNLRKSAQDKLGPEVFSKAYEYLKKARYKDDGATSTVDENHILANLRQITSKISECFLIDQLLFLEKQAEISENFQTH